MKEVLVKMLGDGRVSVHTPEWNGHFVGGIKSLIDYENRSKHGSVAAYAYGWDPEKRAWVFPADEVWNVLDLLEGTPWTVKLEDCSTEAVDK